MTSQITENIQNVILPLVPASIVNDISCFVFYDKHPRDVTSLDITICTQRGEVREYYQRNLLFSIRIDGVSNPSKIKILRNKDCKLFYLIFSNDELIILSRKEKLEIQHRLMNVERFDFDDASCSGQACLKILLKDDAVPLIFDENFIGFRTPDMSETFTELSDDECFPIVRNLKRKLTEARYSIENNKKMLKEFMDLRQRAAFSAYKTIHPNLDDSLLKGCLNKMGDALKIQSQIPLVKICNKKIIVAYIVKNDNNEPLENVHILLHGTTPQSLVYTTKIFERSHIAPYWMENGLQTLKQKTDTAIVLVIDVSEIKSNVTSTIEYHAVMFYTKSGKECFLPTHDVELSLSDLEKPEFDVMSCGEIDHYTILAILATSIKTDLLLLHIDKREDEEPLGMFIFNRYLGMEYVLSENVVLHNKPFFSFLKSIMVVKQAEIPDQNGLSVTVYTRRETEVLFLLQFIRNFVPLKIITAPSGYMYRMLPTHTIATDHDNDILKSTTSTNYYLNYASSIIERSNLTLKYLDDSMIKMNESKDPAIQSKVGTEVDLLAGGVENYLQFREEMLKKAMDGLKITQEDNIDDVFLIDVDM